MRERGRKHEQGGEERIRGWKEEERSRGGMKRATSRGEGLGSMRHFGALGQRGPVQCRGIAVDMARDMAKALTGKKVVADEHAEEHKVIHDPLHVDGKRAKLLHCTKLCRLYDTMMLLCPTRSKGKD